MSDCPTCGLRQWKYDETTLTCKNGHRFEVGASAPKPRRIRTWVFGMSSAAALSAGYLIGHLT